MGTLQFSSMVCQIEECKSFKAINVYFRFTVLYRARIILNSNQDISHKLNKRCIVKVCLTTLNSIFKCNIWYIHDKYQNLMTFIIIYTYIFTVAFM